MRAASGPWVHMVRNGLRRLERPTLSPNDGVPFTSMMMPSGTHVRNGSEADTSDLVAGMGGKRT